MVLLCGFTSLSPHILRLTRYKGGNLVTVLALKATELNPPILIVFQMLFAPGKLWMSLKNQWFMLLVIVVVDNMVYEMNGVYDS